MARPPSTYDGRTSTGKPIRPTIASASSRSVAVPPGGCGMRSSSHSAFHFSRSSARSIDDGAVPAISSGGMTEASLSGVCPPSDTITFGGVPPAAAVSAAITWRTSSVVSGSKYSRSDVS